MVCERGWGGQAADSDWSVRSPPPLLEWHSDVISCQLSPQFSVENTVMTLFFLGGASEESHTFILIVSARAVQLVFAKCKKTATNFCPFCVWLYFFNTFRCLYSMTLDASTKHSAKVCLNSN
jgi:hypothetical protein